MKRLQGKIAVITGAGGTGNGRASALSFNEEGAIIVAVDRAKDANAGVEITDKINALGGTATSKTLNLLDDQSVKAVLQATVAEFGRLDILFNVAIPGRAPPPELSGMPQWEWTYKG